MQILNGGLLLANVLLHPFILRIQLLEPLVLAAKLFDIVFYLNIELRNIFLVLVNFLVQILDLSPENDNVRSILLLLLNQLLNSRQMLLFSLFIFLVSNPQLLAVFSNIFFQKVNLSQ